MGLTPRQKALKPTVRRLASKGWTADAIARLYKLTRREVRALLDAPVAESPPAIAEGWEPAPPPGRAGADNGNASLTDAEAVSIRARRAEGASRRDLAREYQVSVATITRVTRGETYRDAADVGAIDLVESPPAPAPAPEPQGERWEEPPGDRRRRG